jgi:hypothetical protein
MVKLQDPVLAKRYGIKTFPSLVYFRNGNPLTFDGNVLVLNHQFKELTLMVNRQNQFALLMIL